MIAAIILFAVLVFIVCVLYVLNKNTKVPEGCENLKADCEGCRIVTCINHPSKGEKTC